MSLTDCKLIELPKITDDRGKLTFVEGNKHIPFDIKRVFYLYDIPTSEDRGAHAHKQLHQFLICLSGNFDVLADDGTEKKLFNLKYPWLGLHIPPMIWASEMNFTPGSVCLVLASDFYDESDYHRSYADFLADCNS
jgi:dTDP-4-dehydrorhamnose 3,5-epimerase-like enzyme